MAYEFVDLRCVRDFRGAALIVRLHDKETLETVDAVFFLPHGGEAIGRQFVFDRDAADSLAENMVRAWLHEQLQAVQLEDREPPTLEPCDKEDLAQFAVTAPDLLRAAMSCGEPVRGGCAYALRKVEEAVDVEDITPPAAHN